MFLCLQATLVEFHYTGITNKRIKSMHVREYNPGAPCTVRCG